MLLLTVEVKLGPSQRDIGDLVVITHYFHTKPKLRQWPVSRRAVISNDEKLVHYGFISPLGTDCERWTLGFIYSYRESWGAPGKGQFNSHGSDF